MNKRAAALIISLVASLAFALASVSSAQAETNYCAGYRIGYLLAYCPPRNSSCMRRRVQCPRPHGSTLADGMLDGQVKAIRMRQAEHRLALAILKRRKKNGK